MIGNLLKDLALKDGQERFDEILRYQGLRVERIVSQGHASPEGFWYDQAWDEWVLVLSGQAELEFDDRRVVLEAGDHVMIAARERYRVSATDPTQPTIWLAIHWDGPLSRP